MSELSFLLDLLLNQKLPKATKDLIANRIREIDQRIESPPWNGQKYPTIGGQSPSTIAAFIKHGIELPAEKSIRVENVAQTPATSAAMASRQQAIAESLAGKVDKVTGRPRKF